MTEEPAYDENGVSLVEASERAVFRPRPKETRPILKEDFYGHVGQATLHSIVPDAVLLSRRRRTTARQTKMAPGVIPLWNGELARQSYRPTRRVTLDSGTVSIGIISGRVRRSADLPNLSVPPGSRRMEGYYSPCR